MAHRKISAFEPELEMRVIEYDVFRIRREFLDPLLKEGPIRQPQVNRHPSHLDLSL
ncbi:MAG TPA: hypothetical protein VG124_12245 [Beijerinckiaceae bacterium]|jgi:hypothetical protein|nr:hypothetical protein [Beijerinckiaceae bacterium]